MTRAPATFYGFSGRSFEAQAWDGETRVSCVRGLSYDAAKHLAQSATLTGLTGRVMGEDQDYCEVYTPDGVRVGTFAQTTLVRGAKP